MSVILHDYPRSSASYRVRIGLGLKGIAYESRVVNLLAQEQRAPAYLASNPQGLVPVLEIDGIQLTQSLAILEYLEETRPAPSLFPEDAAGRARVRAIALAIACDIHPVSNLKVLNRVEALTDKATRQEWNCSNIAAGLASVEEMLRHPASDQGFCHGSGPSLADCVLIPQIYNALRWEVDLEPLPRVRAAMTACQGIPAFEAAHPHNLG